MTLLEKVSVGALSYTRTALCMGRPMQTYRLYLRDGTGSICGREDFDAADPETALGIAAIVFDACSDSAFTFDVWRGTEAIYGNRPTNDALLGVMEKRQANIAELEERIRDSNWQIASSKQLLQRLESLRETMPKTSIESD